VAPVSPRYTLALDPAVSGQRARNRMIIRLMKVRRKRPDVKETLRQGSRVAAYAGSIDRLLISRAKHDISLSLSRSRLRDISMIAA